jgi:chain length determinant protein tyrosine kinase EpsG
MQSSSAPMEVLLEDDALPGSSAERPIGQIIRQAKSWSDDQVNVVLLHQQSSGLRFGDSAIALGLASPDEVMWALSQQFSYSYEPADSADLKGDLVLATQPFGDQADAFRELRSELMMGMTSQAEMRRALAVVSPDCGDGKSFIASNLAVAFSQLAERTLIVDANMRTPRQHEVFKVDLQPGLSQVLAGRSSIDSVLQMLEPNLYLMPAGTVPPNPLELIQRPEFGLLLCKLLGKFQYVIVDTPAAERGADARALAMHCGSALVVGRRDKTSMKTMRKLSDAFTKAKVRLAGVVMNDR